MLKPASTQTTVAQARREAVLSAALQRFSHCGFRRTSMEDIAQEAGVSRAALYLHFKNKEEIFRALAVELNQRAVDAAEVAARTEGPIAARAARVLEAKIATFFDIVYRSSHARELLDENSRICGDISSQFRLAHLAVLRRLVTAAANRSELDPRRVGLTSGGAAELLLDCARGLELNPEITPAMLRRRLQQMTRVMLRGLGDDGSPKSTN